MLYFLIDNKFGKHVNKYESNMQISNLCRLSKSDFGAVGV